MKNKKKKSQPKSEIDASSPTRDSVESKLRSVLASATYIPMSQTQLLKAMNISSQEEAMAKKIITDLLLSGAIEAKKKKLSLIKPKAEEKKPMHSGTLRMHPRGFGFVVPDATSLLKEDIFIPKNLVGSAVDGDIVEIAVYPSKKKDKGPEGKVLNVIKRSRSHLAGIVLEMVDDKKILGFIPLFGLQRLAEIIPSSETPVKIGDRVILKVIDWGSQTKSPVCEISHLIGHISDPSLDIPAALEEFCIRGPFPDEVINEAKSLGSEVSAKDKKSRTDLTHIETFTIDPETAKDFDDALSLMRDETGFTLYVHIADVAHYVKQSSALDREALLRGNSTYFPGRCVPMLPEELSNHLCSLKPGVVRLCMTVIMSFDNEGTLLSHQIKRTYIHSKTRFTYEEAKSVLDGKMETPHAKTLHAMKDLCLLLKKKRYERGSIDFALPEVVLEIDKEGMPTGFKIVEYDISHQLVEEFMLKANEVVAKSLADQGKPVVFRIHEEPAQESLDDFGTLARALGFPLSDSHDVKQLQKLFEAAKGSEFANQLAVAFIRSMKLACYSAENVGHFGLSLEHYCHFTSPIRRYPDLVVQRLLFNEQDPSSNFELIAMEASDKERLSFKAEMSVKTLKKLRLLNKYFQEEPEKIYTAHVSKIKPFGIYFEIPPYSLEGFLHISELDNDYFIFDPNLQMLKGEKTGKQFRIADTVSVKIESINFILQECKWEMVGITKREKKNKKPKLDTRPKSKQTSKKQKIKEKKKTAKKRKKR